MSAYVTTDRGIELARVQYLHDFAVCHLTNDCFETVLQYSDTRALSEVVEVPGHPECSGTGCDMTCGRCAARGRVDTLVILRRMYNCLWLINRSGYTLRGRFGARNFLVSDLLSVRMSEIHLSKWTVTGEDEDHNAFVEAVLDFFEHDHFPEDIRQWLLLIRGGRRGYVVRYHPCLMDPLLQINWLLLARDVLEGLRRVNRELYGNMINIWMDDYLQWNKRRDFRNEIINDARTYVDPWTQRLASFDADIRGVLKLLRDTKEHPAKEWEAGDRFPLVVAQDFPNLMSDLHIMLHRARLLPQLHLEATMA